MCFNNKQFITPSSSIRVTKLQNKCNIGKQLYFNAYYSPFQRLRFKRLDSSLRRLGLKESRLQINFKFDICPNNQLIIIACVGKVFSCISTNFLRLES